MPKEMNEEGFACDRHNKVQPKCVYIYIYMCVRVHVVVQQRMMEEGGKISVRT